MRVIEGGKGIRSFIAISLPIEIKKQLENLSQNLKNHLKGSNSKITWIKPKSIHLTLKFLGNITESQTSPIMQKLNEIANNTVPFRISIEGLGVFPNFNHPRVIWVGIKQGDAPICLLQRRVEAKLSDLGFRMEKKEFNAHFTLGRVKSIQSRSIISRSFHAIENQYIGTMVVNNINLIKSTLLSQGAEYDILGTALFNKKLEIKDMK